MVDGNFTEALLIHYQISDLPTVDQCPLFFETTRHVFTIKLNLTIYYRYHIHLAFTDFNSKELVVEYIYANTQHFTYFYVSRFLFR